MRVLRENEEFRIAARRELLTDDLLKLPLEFTEFRTNVDGRFEAVQEDIRDVRRDMDGRFEAVDRRFDSVQEDIRGVRRDVDGLGNSFRREVRAQPSFRGVYAQRETVANRP